MPYDLKHHFRFRSESNHYEFHPIGGLKGLKEGKMLLFRFCIIAISVTALPALGDTYTVYPIAHIGDFPSIQAAVDFVQDGDIIELGDGIFSGEGNRDIDYLGKEITIRSQSGNPHSCTIDCGGPYEMHRGFFFDTTPSGAVLEGVTIQNGYHFIGGAIACLGESYPLISQCILYKNTSYSYGGGIYCDVGSSPTVRQCTFAENFAYDAGGGLCI